jgi:hypothetical protein
LKEERAQVERQLSGLDAVIRAFANVYTGAKPGRKRRKMSAKGRARIAAAQRARWARVKGQQKVVPIAKPKRSMSASARRKIAAAQRRGGQRSSGRRKPPEGDERRPFSEQARSKAQEKAEEKKEGQVEKASSKEEYADLMGHQPSDGERRLQQVTSVRPSRIYKGSVVITLAFIRVSS